MNITTFGELSEGTAFQIIWAVPGPRPNPPAQTAFTKIAPRLVDSGIANAVYRSDRADMHNAVEVPETTKVLRLSSRYALSVEEARP